MIRCKSFWYISGADVFGVISGMVFGDCSTDMVAQVQTIELRDGGVLLYDEMFLPAELADRYFVTVRGECLWEQKPGIFGHMQPRLIASFGDEGVTYRYSGTTNIALPWTRTLLEIKEKIEAIHGQYNYCLLNRYRSGQDSMGMHADNEPEMGNVIGSVSLGATRKFRIKHNKSKETMTFSLAHGSLLIMAGTMQQFWKHEIPKTRKNVGERINLTYRQIIEPT
ncbi:MAG: alpha-ketoglutarate-dependent dioxygenase AlkB [Planctomycetaceae bacterium]